MVRPFQAPIFRMTIADSGGLGANSPQDANY